MFPARAAQDRSANPSRIERRIDRARAVKRLQEDNAALDARVVERAIQIGELRDELREVRAKSH